VEILIPTLCRTRLCGDRAEVQAFATR
jgi:hypothetical protein